MKLASTWRNWDCPEATCGICPRLELPSQPQSQAARYELASTSIHDDNEDGENVSIQTWQLTNFADPYDLTLPPHSINVITWNTGPTH